MLKKKLSGAMLSLVNLFGRWAMMAALFSTLSGCTLPSAAVPPVSDVSVAGSRISRTATSVLGTRYVYGGSSPSKGFDCSGLVCWVYGQNGIAMPRTAREQSAVGRYVSKNKLKPGDLVVFKISSGYHTGIYAGKGKFVHSPSSGKTVRIEDINSTYYKNKFIAGRRHKQIY